MAVNPRAIAFYGIGAAAAAVAFNDAADLYRNRNQSAGLFQDILTFPSDLNRALNVPYMSMQFSAYTRRSITDQPFYDRQMNISLPIPDGLVEQTSLGYDKSAQLGPVAGSAVESLSQGPLGSVGDLVNRIGNVAAGTGAQAIQTLASRAPGALNAVSALSGLTVNPFQTVLFKSPDFRSHTFRWKFAPESVFESETLRNIIDTFKYHSLPGISAAGGVFFSYPEILEINFRPSDTYLYKFKPCVVEGITVNFTPGNGPSFHRSTNAPTAIQLELRVQEIEIWTKADYLRQNGRFGTFVAPQFVPEETNQAAAVPFSGAGGFGLEQR
jgi:hypothetical protein